LFSIPTTLTGVFNVLILQVDRFFVGYYLPPRDLGVYQAVSQSAIAFAVILGAFNSIFAPMIADLYHSNDLPRLAQLYRISTKWGLYLALPLYVAILVAPGMILLGLFGKAYAGGSLALVVLSTGQLINVGTGALSFLLVMTGRQKQWMITTGIMLALDILLNVLLTPRFGLVGSALATGLAVSGVNLVALFWVRSSMRLWPFDLGYAKGVASAVVAGMVGLAALRIPASADWLSLALVVAGVGSTFVITLVLLGLAPEDRVFLEQLRARLARAR
jgi:O-antigen/teichoic acid export membrane protein